MQPQTPPEAGANFIGRLRFPPAVESEFQEDYYARIRSTLRFRILLLAGISWIFSFVLFTKGVAWPVFGVALLSLPLIVATFRRDFSHYWQPFLVSYTLAMLLISAVSAAVNADAGAPFLGFYSLVVIFRVQCLQTRWTGLQLGAALMALVASALIGERS